MKPTNRFEVLSLDVWGNETDGYEVNDAHRIATIDFGDVSQPLDSLTDRQIMNRYKAVTGAATARHLEISNNSDTDSIYIDVKREGRPLMELRRVYE